MEFFMVKIIVDAMGGDNAPAAPVQGAIKALEKDADISLILAGRREDIEAELAKLTYDKSRVEIMDCRDVIDMNDIPTEAIRKREASMVKAYRALKENDDIAALVTAGSTGAAIVGGQLILGRIRGIKRPALCPAIPNARGGYTLLCDCGANAECKPAMLCQFAVLASAYAQVGFGIKNPKVGLLNNGTEEHKGDPLRQQTYKLLSKMDAVNFGGNMEGRDIMLSDFDVAVCDGFSGNVALKSMEGCGKLILGMLKKEATSSLRSKIGTLFLMKSLKRMMGSLDFEAVGGALLLGVKKVVIKSHGSSKPRTITAAVLNAAATYRGGLIGKVEELLSSVDWDNLTPKEEE